MAAKAMKAALEGCKDLRLVGQPVRIKAALNDESRAQLEALADALTAPEA
jgi:hypothetical protein